MGRAEERKPSPLVRSAVIALVVPLFVLVAFGMLYAGGVGLVMLGVVLHAVYAADRRGTPADRSRAQRQFVGLLLGALLAGALGTIAFFEFKSVTLSACDAAERQRTHLAQKDAYDEIHSRAWIARRFGAPSLERCYEESQSTYKPGGACPRWPLDAMPCTCGGMKWPDDVHCGAKRVYCGCLHEGDACRVDEDCCSGQCAAGRCAGGYSSLEVSRLHCVEP